MDAKSPTVDSFTNALALFPFIIPRPSSCPAESPSLTLFWVVEGPHDAKVRKAAKLSPVKKDDFLKLPPSLRIFQPPRRIRQSVTKP
jgi:hypothetical protein